MDVVEDGEAFAARALAAARAGEEAAESLRGVDFVFIFRVGGW